jgi:hypothetical protein
MKEDQFGFSPDIGKFVIREGVTYSEYGFVYCQGAIYRGMPCKAGAHENYADWTDTQRAEKMAQTEAKNDQMREEQKRRSDARKLLVEQARKKLTEEEFDAVLDYGAR